MPNASANAGDDRGHAASSPQVGRGDLEEGCSLAETPGQISIDLVAQCDDRGLTADQFATVAATTALAFWAYE